MHGDHRRRAVAESKRKGTKWGRGKKIAEIPREESIRTQSDNGIVLKIVFLWGKILATGRRRNEDDESAGKRTAKRGLKMGDAEKSRPALKTARTGAKEHAWLGLL